jgi:hypothetical protein
LPRRDDAEDLGPELGRLAIRDADARRTSLAADWCVTLRALNDVPRIARNNAVLRDDAC